MLGNNWEWSASGDFPCSNYGYNMHQQTNLSADPFFDSDYIIDNYSANFCRWFKTNSWKDQRGRRTEKKMIYVWSDRIQIINLWLFQADIYFIQRKYIVSNKKP